MTDGAGVSLWDPWWHAALAFAAAVAAGAANAVAGAGSVISFPTLVWLGLPPVVANATNAVGLWPGSLAAAWSYRRRLGEVAARWYWLTLPAVVGGGAGGYLLLRLPPAWFDRIAPFLVIGAASLVGLEPALRSRASAPGTGGAVPADPPGRTGTWLAWGTLLLLAISLYGGYFGAGLGILLLVGLGVLRMRDLHRANALKNFLAVAAKAAAVVYFIVLGAVSWPAALLMTAGAVLGGYVAGDLIQKVEAAVFRWVVVAVGVLMGLLMLVSRGL